MLLGEKICGALQKSHKVPKCGNAGLLDFLARKYRPRGPRAVHPLVHRASILPGLRPRLHPPRCSAGSQVRRHQAGVIRSTPVKYPIIPICECEATVTQTEPCSQLPLAVILAPRARPRHNGFVVHAWLHRAGCRAVRTARSWRGIVPFTHLARQGRMTLTRGRLELLAALGGAAAAAWPVAARAQQGERMRRIGVLLPAAPDDAEFQSWVGAFLQVLAQSGWITGRNIRIETRWTKFDAEETLKYAAKLVALASDAIVATGISTVGPLLRLSRTVPIVFAAASDPFAAGRVESMARPGGNVTVFMTIETGMSAKWLELLKEIAPGVKRAAVLRSLAIASGPGQFGAMQAVAPLLGVELRPIDTRDAEQIERAIVTFASEPNGGLIAATGGGGPNNRGLTVALAARHRLRPAYPNAIRAITVARTPYGPD